MSNWRALKRTKIVATLGPACTSEESLTEMIEAGVNVFRVNFSHAKHDQVIEIIKRIRRISKKLNLPVGILGDLRGPRIRVGEMENGEIELEDGKNVRLTPKTLTGTPELISQSHDKLHQDLSVGATILVDDGNLSLEVTEIHENGDVDCLITRGGPLKNNKGINLPGSKVSIPALTNKDRKDVVFGLEQNLDFFALSFVQTKEDVRQLNDMIAEAGHDTPVIAKIENQISVDEIESILDEAYGAMVARGDLALEVSLQEVPIAQKRIISACRRRNKPSITATQMLESMTFSHKPTRAEVADVANAVLDGTDAVMLSGESAVGKDPVLVVDTMAQIICRAEQAWRNKDLARLPELEHSKHTGEAVSDAARYVAECLNAAAMIAYTAGGGTVRKLACHRSLIPIFALCANKDMENRLTLTWGIKSTVVEEILGTAHMTEIAIREARKMGLIKKGDHIVLTAGAPFGQPGTTNLLKVEKVPA